MGFAQPRREKEMLVMAAKYRVGVIGCGGMGRHHTEAWQAKPATDVVAVMDVVEESAQRVAQENGVERVYTDYREMLQKEKLDIVSIPTWQGVRAEITVAAAKAGVKAIIGEKPMSASLGEADDMIDACDRNGVKLAIGHNRRFFAVDNEVRRLVASGAIGEPVFFHHHAKPNAGLLNTGTHCIDAWRYYLSDPETLWVVGQTGRYTDRWERRSRAEDFCMALICFEGGARAVYEGDLPEPAITFPTVTGTEGKIVIKGDKILMQQDGVGGWKEIDPPPVDTDQYQELLDWVEGKKLDHRGNGKQARYTMEIMMAIYESLRINNVVKMPLTTKESPLEMMVADGTLPVLQEGRYDLRAPVPDQTWKRS